MGNSRRSPFSRRVFIQRLSFFGGGVVLLGSAACKDEPSKSGKRALPQSAAPAVRTTSHRSFTDEAFAALAAACERILPRDEDPGALEANVPEYIDRMLQTEEMQHLREDFVSGVDALDRRAQGLFGKGFAALAPAQQDQILTEFKDSGATEGEARFYEYLLVLTLEGMFGDPSYGGNKDKVGWALIGFGTSEPPQGYEGSKHLHVHGAGHGAGHGGGK